jgi:hypothetical protein
MGGTGSRDTGGASSCSPRSGRRRTSKTSGSELTPAMALEIFQSAVLELQRAGVDVSWVPYEGDVVLFRLRGVRLCASCRILRPAEEVGGSGVCRYCAASLKAPGDA